jgi:hypothetical protein
VSTTRQRALGEVADVFNGKTPPKAEHRRKGFPVLKIRDVDEAGHFIGPAESFVDKEFAESYSSKWIQPNDILILNAAPNAAYVASKTFFADKSVAGFLPTGEWLLIRTRANGVLPGYLNFWLKTAPTQKAIRSLVKGIHLYPKDVANLSIEIPSLDEQRRIIALLERTAGIRRRATAARAKARAIIPALFLDTFGDPATNPKRWPVRRLGELSDFSGGTSLPPGSPFNGQSEGFLHCKVSTLALEGNARIISCSLDWGPDFSSKAAIAYPGSGWFETFRLEGISSGSTVPQLNKQDLSPLSIICPPLGLQTAYAETSSAYRHSGPQPRRRREEGRSHGRRLLGGNFRVMLDRLQAAWGYTSAEIWRPLFDRYRDKHPDLPIEIERVILVRPHGMRQIFVEAGKLPVLDELRADVATFLDLPRDARAALRRIRPRFFTGGRAIALLLTEIDEGLRAYDDPELGRYYGDRVERFLARHVLPYRLDRNPLKLTPLVPKIAAKACYEPLRW